MRKFVIETESESIGEFVCNCGGGIDGAGDDAGCVGAAVCVGVVGCVDAVDRVAMAGGVVATGRVDAAGDDEDGRDVDGFGVCVDVDACLSTGAVSHELFTRGSDIEIDVGIDTWTSDA